MGPAGVVEHLEMIVTSLETLLDKNAFCQTRGKEAKSDGIGPEDDDDEEPEENESESDDDLDHDHGQEEYWCTGSCRKGTVPSSHTNCPKFLKQSHQNQLSSSGWC